LWFQARKKEREDKKVHRAAIVLEAAACRDIVTKGREAEVGAEIEGAAVVTEAEKVAAESVKEVSG
jgi:hypothetical protein